MRRGFAYRYIFARKRLYEREARVLQGAVESAFRRRLLKSLICCYPVEHSIWFIGDFCLDI